MPLRKTKRPLYERIGLTREEYYNDDILKPHERDFVRKFSRLGGEMRWIKPDINAVGRLSIPTNDFVWKDLEWELKRPEQKRYKSISRMIHKAEGKDNFMIDFENTCLEEKVRNQLSKYNLNNPHRQIKTLYVFSRGKIFEIVLKKARP